MIRITNGLNRLAILGIVGVCVASFPLSAQRSTHAPSHKTAAKKGTSVTKKSARTAKLSEADLALYARVLYMQEHRVFDTTIVNAGLASRNPAVRQGATFAVAQVSPANRDAVRPVLERLATDKDTIVAANAQFGTRLIEEQSYDTVTDNDTLITRYTMAHYDSIVRTVVVPTLLGKPPVVTLVTTRGTLRLAMFGTQAPLTVANFLSLVQRKFYDSLTFHRVEPSLLIQGGDPLGNGTGNSDFIHDEYNRLDYARATVGMATAGPNTGSCQFFVMMSPRPDFDGHYTLFARVLSGMEAVDAMQIGDTIISARIE